MQLNHKTFGEGEPLVILHGLFGMLDNWKTMAVELAKDFTVVLVDLPNHGKSPHIQPHTYTNIADALNQFLEDNWLYNVHLIGHSMGAKVAMQLALDYPDMVQNLISIDMLPRAYESAHDQIIVALNELAVDQLQSRKEAQDFLFDRLKNESVVLFLLKNLKREKAGGFSWKCNLPQLTLDYPKIMEAIQSDEIFDKPSLFIGGKKSNYVTEKDIQIVRPLFPNSKIQMIENAGHWIHADQPQELYKHIMDFIID